MRMGGLQGVTLNGNAALPPDDHVTSKQRARLSFIWKRRALMNYIKIAEHTKTSLEEKQP